MTDDDDFDDYDAEPDPENYVGYGHPPKHTRWQKGHCPNPSGRRRAMKTRAYYLREVALRPIEIKVGNRTRAVSQLEAIILIVKNRAIAGHGAASKIYEKLLGLDVSEQPSVPKGVLFLRPKMTEEEFRLKFEPGYDGSDANRIVSPRNPVGDDND